MIFKLKLSPKDSTEQKLRALHALQDLEPLCLNVLYICLDEIPGKNYRQRNGKSKASR